MNDQKTVIETTKSRQSSAVKVRRKPLKRAEIANEIMRLRNKLISLNIYSFDGATETIENELSFFIDRLNIYPHEKKI